MNIDLQARDFNLTNAHELQIRQKLKVVLSRFSHKIRLARVVLSDINGPKGGKDKRCAICVEVNNHKTVVVEEVSENMFESINRCSQRVKRTLTRMLNKRRVNTREDIFIATTWTSDGKQHREVDQSFDERREHRRDYEAMNDSEEFYGEYPSLRA